MSFDYYNPDVSMNAVGNTDVSYPLELVGHLSIPEYINDLYEGPYEVTPSSTFQLLPTADCLLKEDIIVRPISYTEVINEQGGLTITIGD